MAWNGGEIARVTAILNSTESGVIENVFHLQKVTGSISNSNAIIAILEWIEDVYLEIDQVISEEVDFDAVNIFLVDTAEALGDQPWTTLVAGTATGAMQASGLSVLTSGITGFSRRVGRKYWGAMSVSAFLDNDWPTATVTAAAAAADIAYDAFVASNGVSFLPGVYDRVTGILREATTRSTVSNPAYQRRRRLGTGV